MHLISAALNYNVTRRQDVGWVSEEEICLQASLHLSPRPRHRLRSHGGRKSAQLQQIHGKTNCNFLSRF